MMQKRPLSERIRDVSGVLYTPEEKKEVQEDTDAMVKECAEKADRNNPFVISVLAKVNRSSIPKEHFLAWEYVTRRLNKHRAW